MTDEAGNVVAVIELDPWGGETDRSVNQRQQPYRYTTYERDGDGVDQALMRSYHGWWTRFNELDPWEGSYDLTDPQSLNRYAYVRNDPVTFVDPDGLQEQFISTPETEEVIRIHTAISRTTRPLRLPAPQVGGVAGSMTGQIWWLGRGWKLDYYDPIGGGGGVSTPTPPQNPAPQQRKSDFPCPPTAEEILNSPVFQAAISRANEVARSDQRRGFIEAGGWVLMNRRGNLRVVIKPPEARDTSTMVYGLGEPGRYIRGHGRREVVVADFHTHVNEISNPDEIPTANARRVPGIWIYPSGRAEAYGPKRGLFGRNLPRGCR